MDPAYIRTSHALENVCEGGKRRGGRESWARDVDIKLAVAFR
jgi:hypothetical protein